MPTWKLEIEYEGTRYRGWQIQPNARTVQGELRRAAEKVLDARVDLGGSGRTDAGVHALAQIAHLKVPRLSQNISIRQLQFGLNDNLPADINVVRVAETHANFHARHEAVARFYVYQIATRRTAFAKPFVWWVKDRLDVAAMQTCCERLVGRHDFASFCELDDKQNSTVVKVAFCSLAVSGGLILIRIGASHFLWKMVRRIVGALAEVGRGKLTVGEFENLLVAPRPSQVAAWTAPPSGLFLERVVYPDEKVFAEIVPAFPVG